MVKGGGSHFDDYLIVKGAGGKGGGPVGPRS